MFNQETSLYTMGGLRPVRGVSDGTHEAAGNDTGSGHGDDPTKVDPDNHAPVDRAPVAVAETDTDNGTSDALGGGDGKFWQIMLAGCRKMR